MSELVLAQRLGEGGAATVYAARWRGAEVSAKVARGADGAADLAAEARVLARVAHPALLAVLGDGALADGRPYLVLPRLRGEDLAVRLARGPLAVEHALAVVTAVAGALGALHGAGIAHRDLKPENVFLADDGVYLLDLGLARALDASTASLRIRGTHDVMAPERLYGEPASVATEVYELAALAWAALAGALPWPAGAAPSARRWLAALPVEGERGAALEDVLRGALSTLPERRPASIAALAAALAAAAQAAGPQVTARRTADVAPVIALPAPGTLIAETYRLTGVLGRGGAGTVFAAEHVRLPRRLAIKLLSPEHDDPDARARFRREAEIIAGLAHPHVVEVLDYDVDERGAPFMVMARLDGETLRERLRRGPLPARDVAELVRQAAAALAVAHARGVVHRDIKPSNLFLRTLARDEQPAGPADASARGPAIHVAVLDFGISKVLGHSDRTQTGLLLGSPGYAAPEQIRGDRVSAATDVFALAALAYEALTGRRAFDGDTREIVLHQILHAEPPRLAARAVDAVLRRALAKRAERRTQSVAVFADELCAALATSPGSGGRAASPASARRSLVGAALVAVATPLLVAWMWSHAEVVTSTLTTASPITTQHASPASAPAPPGPPAPNGPRSERAGPVAVATRAVHLVRVPATARVTIDGVTVVGEDVTLSPGRHTLRASAPGFAPQQRVVAGEDAAIEVRLHRPRAEPALRSLLEK